MKKSISFLAVMALCLMLLAPSQLGAQGDILIHLRFYQGVRSQGQMPESTKPIASYGLRPLFVGSLVSEADLKEEEAELKRVFNLDDLVTMVQTQWGWERQGTDKRFQMVVLNEHTFVLQVTRAAAPDAFRVEVISKGREKDESLLDTEIVLPQKKSSVFGFEDSLGKPYFLALQRLADAGSVREERPQANQGLLELLHKVDPELPDKVKQERIPGVVIVDVTVNEKGDVAQAYLLKGLKVLGGPVLNAIKQWKYRPQISAGKPVPVRFVITIRFPGSGKMEMATSVDEKKLRREEDEAFRAIRTLFEKRKGKDYKAEPYDFSFRATNLNDVISFISRTIDVPIQVDEHLQRIVSCEAKQVPWDRALAKFLLINELEIEDEGDYLRVCSRTPAIFPTKGYLSSLFTIRINPFTMKRELHSGIDIAAQASTPVLCTAEGTVLQSEYNESQGNFVVVDHHNGYTSFYGRLLRRTVKPGEKVKMGQEIGLVGSTGQSTAPHLHFEIHFMGKPVNPFDVLKSDFLQ